MFKISPGYHQLANVFTYLENAHFEPENDFGANITSSFGWFIAPKALKYLEENNYPGWISLKSNSQFVLRYEAWQGYDLRGIDITLKI